MPHNPSYGPRWQSVTKEVALRALAFVVPPVCLACRSISSDLRLEIGLCSRCRNQLEPVGPAEGKPVRVLSLCWYKTPMIEIIHALKFQRLGFLGEELGTKLAQEYRDRLASFDVIVPVPLNWRRRFSRGYNQAEEIARALGKGLDIPVRNLLRRTRRTMPQTRLSHADRRRNLERAFRSRRKHKIEGRNVILVDDVVTTGATLEAAVSTLERRGARSVLAVTAARTPAPGRRPCAGKLKGGESRRSSER